MERTAKLVVGYGGKIDGNLIHPTVVRAALFGGKEAEEAAGVEPAGVELDSGEAPPLRWNKPTECSLGTFPKD